MACPMGYGVRFEGGVVLDEDVEPHYNNVSVAQQDTGTAFSDRSVSYSEYLQLDKLLRCQKIRSAEADQLVPDEHLFIIIHQAYELWFKQIIFDIDHVRNLLDNKIVDETKTLQIVSLLERTVRILKLLVDQMLVLETMSPLDFVEFRKYLASASGFQSLQFRLLENKLGMTSEHRVRYNSANYGDAFSDNEDRSRLLASEREPSLFVLIERWLSRTPGIYDEEMEQNVPTRLRNNSLTNGHHTPLYTNGPSKYSNHTKNEASTTVSTPQGHNSAESDPVTTTVHQCGGITASDGTGVSVEYGTSEEDSLVEHLPNDNDDDSNQTEQKRKNFWNRYLEAVDNYLNDMHQMSKDENLSPEERREIHEEYLKTKKSFQTITDEKEYQKFLDKRERRLSHNALKGALMIYFYRDMPRFSQPYQILTFLMDIDSLLQKWRYNHVMLVQRMLGSKQGTGGSSGYYYLRTTVSDRYKVFLDLFNLSTWLIPRVYIPKLSPKMVKTLSEHSNLNNHVYDFGRI